MSASVESSNFVPIGSTPVDVGRSSSSGLRLGDPTVSRRHATLSRTQQGLVIVDHDSRFGSFINGLRVRTAVATVGDRIQFGTTAVYRVVKDGLRPDSAARGASIAVKHVNLVGKKGKLLVENASFGVEPDSFVGILGPSGAGKSTLLNALASYHRLASGRLLFDGGKDLAEERDAYRSVLGHVPQEDIVHATLTARECLAYAARLRFGSSAPEYRTAVDQALSRVGLTEHAEKQTADLSGGQRKRLSVAIELLKKPRLLMLDEPTSGLDPGTESALMEQLRMVCRHGTTVLCTTHLMANIHLFDSVVVLGVKGGGQVNEQGERAGVSALCQLLRRTFLGGRVNDQGERAGVGCVAYVGSPTDLLDHFNCRNYADLYDKLAKGEFPVASTTSADHGTTPTVAIRPQSDSRWPKPKTSRGGSSTKVSLKQFVSPTIAEGYWGQVSVVFQRALLVIGRDPFHWGMMLAQPIVLGLLVALTQFNASKAMQIYFFAVVIAIWLGLNNSARDLVRDRKLYVRERLGGLRPGAYLTAKAAVYGTLGVGQLVLLLFVLQNASNLEFKDAADDWSKKPWLELFSVVSVCYFCGLGLGLLVSAVVRTEEAVVAALPLLIMPQLLLSAVATGHVQTIPSDPHPFRPIAAMADDFRQLSASGRITDGLSLLCYSRPGTLLLERPTIDGYSSTIWLGDLCHLFILLAATWLVLVLAFSWAEERWPRLIKLG